MKPLLAITMGDINGVGPEILAKASTQDRLYEMCTPLILGCPKTYAAAGGANGGYRPPQLVSDSASARTATDTLSFLDVDVSVPPYRPGTLDSEAGACAMRWLEKSVDLAISGAVDGIVTCPINKEGIHQAGYTFRGHTDYIAERTVSPDYRMCLFTDRIRIIHITDHLPLRDAVAAVSMERILTSVRLGHDALCRLNLPRKRIAVAGLNPHAGEAGAFGSEEQDIIAPAVSACRSEGIDCTGPYSPDTLFKRGFEGEFDLIIAMYHDQGHIPLKLLAMDKGVNVTLGIPIVRTSVDHGTAYDIAGKNMAREQSFLAAVALAAELASTKPS
jgi:4-phospho-D-threonate 3-dehydrogenase / 4-phospho-D-erythronate 3-dehydrogenase